MKWNGLVLIVLLVIGLSWAIFSKQASVRKSGFFGDDYDNWMERMPRWGKIGLALGFVGSLYFFWFVL